MLRAATGHRSLPRSWQPVGAGTAASCCVCLQGASCICIIEHNPAASRAAHLGHAVHLDPGTVDLDLVSVHGCRQIHRREGQPLQSVSQKHTCTQHHPWLSGCGDGDPCGCAQAQLLLLFKCPTNRPSRHTLPHNAVQWRSIPPSTASGTAAAPHAAASCACAPVLATRILAFSTRLGCPTPMRLSKMKPSSRKESYCKEDVKTGLRRSKA